MPGWLGERTEQQSNMSARMFPSRFKNKGQLGQRAQGWHTQSFVEQSRFLREDGKWLYGERRG